MPEMQPEEKVFANRLNLISVGLILGFIFGVLSVLMFQHEPNIPQGQRQIHHTFESTAMLLDANVATIKVKIIHEMGYLEKKAMEADAKHFIRATAAKFSTNDRGLPTKISDNFIQYMALPCSASVEEVLVNIGSVR